MKLEFALIAVALQLLPTASIAAEVQTSLKDPNDRISYSLGANIGMGVKQQTQGVKLNPDLVAAGLKDALTGGKTALTEQEIHESLSALQQTMEGKQSELGEKNKKDGDAFLAENKKKAGVKSLPDGLEYLVLTDGKGLKPKATDTVKVNYKGTLLDGTVFDSSEQRGPLSIRLDGVIKGWTEALQLMSVGSKWRLFIPSELGYGPRGAGGLIGPNSTLIFEVELLAIETAGSH